MSNNLLGTQNENILLNLPLELIENIYKILDFPSVLAMRTVCKASKKWVEVTTINRIKNPLIEYFRISLWGDAVKTEFFFGQKDIQSRLVSRIFIVLVMNHLRIPPLVCQYKLTKMSVAMKRQVGTMFFDKVAPFLRNAKWNKVELVPTTRVTCMLASKFLEGKTLISTKLHLDDSVEAKDFALKFIAELGVIGVFLVFTTDVYQFNDFLVNLAAIVYAIIIYAPSDDTIEDRLNFQLLQQLSFNVLSSRCIYFDLIDGFMKIAKDEANSLANVLSRIQDKDFYFGASTTETEPRLEHFLNIPLAVEAMLNSARFCIRLGRRQRIRCEF